jgi:FkbM family methyltransferase
MSYTSIENIQTHFGQSAEDTSLLRIFNKKSNGFYVDIGAYHPIRYSNTFLLHYLYGWSGINIDASADAIKEFNKYRPNDINICSAVGNKAKARTYYKFEHSGRNTLAEANLKRQEEMRNTRLIGKESIAVTPLKDILDKYLPDNKVIDLLDMDVEGMELEVLNTNDWKKYTPRVILLEDYSINKSGVEKSEIYSFMTSLNYIFSSHHFDTSVYIHKDFNKNEKLEKIKKQDIVSRIRNRQYHRFDPSKISLKGSNLLLHTEKLKNNIENLKAENKKLNQKTLTLEKKLAHTESELQELLNSKSWKITKPLRGVNRIVKK